VPGGSQAHREQITRELIAIYRPSCNEQQFEHAWEDHWIGEYSAPTTGPVARRGPDQSGHS
jgi:phenylacetate-coenzyme A ligase PaaK-like adenylate-forming protein